MLLDLPPISTKLQFPLGNVVLLSSKRTKGLQRQSSPCPAPKVPQGIQFNQSNNATAVKTDKIPTI